MSTFIFKLTQLGIFIILIAIFASRRPQHSSRFDRCGQSAVRFNRHFNKYLRQKLKILKKNFVEQTRELS